MFGTFANAAAVIAGGLIGFFLKKGLKQDVLDSIMKVMGVAIFIIGLNGVLTNMLTVGEGGKISDEGGMLLLISLVVGTLLGEILRLEDRVNSFGMYIEKKVKSDGFAKGFVSASIIFCVGSMGILGAINDGLSGDSSLLFIKSVLDGVTALILASTMGIGVVFAFAPVFVYQGAIALFASSISELLTSSANMISDFSMVGNAIIICIGFNFIFGTKIKTANMLPAIFVPILYNLLIMVEIL
jgi:uncharacterized membrane protein YqgA involved in biofilm formation